MKKLFIAALLLLATSTTYAGGTHSWSKIVDLTAADTTDIYFSGSSYLKVPGPNASGWAIWLKNGVTMACSDVDVIVWPMDEDGDVSTNSSNSIAVWTALDMSDSTTIEHKGNGTLDRCFGIKVIVVPTNGTGTMRLKVLYGID